MKGAEALLRTLVAGGVNVCFGNPGTSEMQLVAALDRVPEMRAVLALFEGVATGAADGFARMTGAPAATLLHLGPGLANGLANLHNALRARSPIVNIVGDHATSHRHLDSPLASDIAGYARQVASWVRSVAHPQAMGSDAAAAVAAARQAPGQPAVLVVPADCAWTEGARPSFVSDPPPPPRVHDAAIEAVANLLRSGETAMLLMTGSALRQEAIDYAGRIAARTGARLACPTFFARLARGAGRVRVDALPYRTGDAVNFLSGVRHLVLVGASAPVAFFAYPDKPSWLTPQGTELHVLARPEHDLIDALARLSDAVGGAALSRVQERQAMSAPTGPLTAEKVMQAVAALLPENAIVVDESISSMGLAWDATVGAAPHDWLAVTGGSIGQGMPVATGAAVACPDRRVVNLEGDGSAMYTLQALWTQAREHLDVTTVILANRAYRILQHEHRLTGAGATPGARANSMLDLAHPALDWVQLARGMGVPAERSTTADAFCRALDAALRSRGPSLIEAVI